MMSKQAAGELLAMIDAPRAPVKIALYRMTGGNYRLRLGSGIGWAPGEWRDYGKALDKLLACQSYGPAELEMCRKVCKPTL